MLEVRASASRPGHGYVKCRVITRNQDGEPVQVLVMNLLVQARGVGPANKADVEASIAALAKQPQSAGRTSRSSSRGGSRGK